MSERRSVWALDDDRIAHPRLSDTLSCDVVVVGAGITGLTSALLLQQRGLDVAVAESHRVAAGTTGRTTGKITSQHGLIYADMIDRHGEAVARGYAEANQAGLDLVDVLVTDLGIECDFTRAPALVYATSEDQADAVGREHEAAVRLGLPARMADGAELPFDTPAVLEFGHQAHFHPVLYCEALAAAIVEGGGRIFEGTRVDSLEEGDDGVMVASDGGRVRAAHAIVATLLPFVDRGGFFAKTRPSRAYGVAARLRSSVPRGMYITASPPIRSFRPWPGGGDGGIIIVGENHETGHGDASPGRWGELERWARETFEVESFEHRWSAQDYQTADGIPYVGRSPLTDRTFVATGFNKWGLANGTAAASMLADLVTGSESEWLDVFDAGRLGDAAAVKKLIADNAHVVRRFVADRMARSPSGTLEGLERGEAALVELDGRSAAVYREPSGDIHAVDPTCTHMGCGLHWNDAENSWDCPCHGSRFDIDGTVLAGPATKPLNRIELESSTQGGADG